MCSSSVDVEDGDALGALREEGALHELDRAHVEPLAGLRHHQHLGVALDLAREDHLLLVAAREITRRLVDALEPHVVGADQPLGMRPDAREIEEEPAPREGGLAVAPQHGVGCDRFVEHEAGALAVLRDVAEPVPMQPLGD